MKSKTTYVKLLHLLLLFFFLISTDSLFAQTLFEGYGAQATGGTGQQVVRVTNLNASGAGSLGNAMGSNRTIVFDVAGTIANFRWEGSASNLTIDGTTAPSPGITLTNNNNGNCLSFDGCINVIVKNIRVRGNAGNDAVNIIGGHDIAFDRLSISGAHDGNLDVTDGAYNVTIQRCIIGGGASDWSGAMLLGYVPTKNISVHHNLFSATTAGGVGERIPFIRANENSANYNEMIVEFRNNVVWRWGRSGGTGSGYATGFDFAGTGMVINNYYYSTSSAGSAVAYNVDPTTGSGYKAYVTGNVSGNSSNFPASNTTAWTIPAWAALTNQDACTAAAQVKAQAGCQPLDATDVAYVNAVTLPNCSVPPPGNQPPVATAGNNITMTLPINSTTLTGSGTDADGTIASYAWTRVNSPAGSNPTIGTPNGTITNVNGLTIAGTYVFRLTVTDNGGATGTDDVTVTVNAAANQPPTANAGSDITITLPVNSTTLSGSGTDADGTIASYAWTRVNSPAGTNLTISTPNGSITNISGLTIAGTYTFRLTVTDNNGATGTDNVIVTVNTAGNLPPTANAGSDITITLPASTTSLIGSGTDADGTIASYTWTRVSSPAGTNLTISTPNGTTTNVSGLTIAGTYVFRLTVTDNSGATGTDNVTVTVNATAPPQGNQPPTACTDNDIVLTLPVNYAQIHGNTSTDPDGVLVSYAWTQLSGPNQAVIINGLTSIATISALTAGIYTFQLQVTDDDGASSIKTMTVTVENQHGAPDAELIIYPNPTAGVLNIKYVASINGKIRITIYDANRRLMRDEVIDKNQVSIIKTIDVSIYGAGAYFVEIMSPDKEKTVKQFVKK